MKTKWYICVNNDEYTNQLTVGKIYILNDLSQIYEKKYEGESIFHTIDDNGENLFTTNRPFIELSEWRNNTINDILENE